MRLFLAIELSDPARRHLHKAQQKLATRVKSVQWTAPEKLHLTLKFLGEVPDADLPRICDTLRAVESPPLDMRAEDLICFPPRRPARIIGALIGPERPDLAQLQSDIESRCTDLGFAREDRPYRPHVTLARAQRFARQQWEEILRKEFAGLWPGPPFQARHFTLMQSRPSPSGSHYIPLATFALSANPG